MEGSITFITKKCFSRFIGFAAVHFELSSFFGLMGLRRTVVTLDDLRIVAEQIQTLSSPRLTLAAFGLQPVDCHNSQVSVYGNQVAVINHIDYPWNTVYAGQS